MKMTVAFSRCGEKELLVKRKRRKKGWDQRALLSDEITTGRHWGPPNDSRVWVDATSMYCCPMGNTRQPHLPTPIRWLPKLLHVDLPSTLGPHSKIGSREWRIAQRRMTLLRRLYATSSTESFRKSFWFHRHRTNPHHEVVFYSPPPRRCYIRRICPRTDSRQLGQCHGWQNSLDQIPRTVVRTLQENETRLGQTYGTICR